MREALKFPEQLVPIRDSLEVSSLFDAETIQHFASFLAALVPCHSIHVC